VRRLPHVEPTPAVDPERGAAARIRYELRAHLPEVSTFPRQAWLRSLRNAVGAATNAELGYVDCRGLPQLRTEVANYLGRARGVAANPDRIVITTGSTHALSLIGRALTRREATRMAFENPSHLVLHAVAERAGQTPVGVPVDTEGLCVDRLHLTDVDSVVVSPAHQFPTGVALSPDRRGLLIGWARSSGGLVIEDDYDAEFRYDRAPVGALQGLSAEHVAYVGSTGKTLAPAIRLGWSVLPADLKEAVAAELWGSMLNVSGIDQLAFADFLRRGEFDRHLRRMRTIYRRRRDVLVAALNERLPGLSVSGIAAGLHVVVELPSRESESAVCTRARSIGVRVQSLSQHALAGYDGPAGLLIGYGSIAEPAIPGAVEQLAQAIEVVRAAPSGNGRAPRRTTSASSSSQPRAAKRRAAGSTARTSGRRVQRPA